MIIMLHKYRSHKTVAAAKIRSVDGQTLHFENGTQHVVSDEYLHKHDPKPGGYFVQYEDGYQSFSPAQAFENGYTRAE